MLQGFPDNSSGHSWHENYLFILTCFKPVSGHAPLAEAKKDWTFAQTKLLRLSLFEEPWAVLISGTPGFCGWAKVTTD